MDSMIDSASAFTAQNAMNAASLRKPAAAKGDAAIDKAAQDFESMFMAQMLQPMFDTIEVNDTFGGGHGEEVMRGMMVQEYGRAVAQSMPTGIGDAVKQEMIRRAKGASATHEVVA